MAGWTILCDFDGTIAVEDVIDSLLDRYGRPGWEALELDWRAGRIGSRECMSGQVALLDMSRAELDAHLAGLWIDHAFPGFVAKARELGVPIRVVSDGLDYAIHRDPRPLRPGRPAAGGQPPGAGHAAAALAADLAVPGRGLRQRHLQVRLRRARRAPMAPPAPC